MALAATSRARFASCIVAGFGSIALLHPAHAQGMFMGLGDLPGAAFGSAAFAISDDGSTVVGHSESANDFPGPFAFRWTLAEGIQGGIADEGLVTSTATGVSATGSTIVGNATYMDSGPSQEFGFLWTPSGGLVGLPLLPNGLPFSFCYGVSDDGSTAVGATENGTFFVEAVMWTTAGGISVVGLGILPGGTSSSAHDISGDGSTIVGSSDTPSGTEAFIWTSGTGMVGIGELPGGDFYSSAGAISSDASVVVGQSESASGREAFRWTSEGGMVGLGDLPGGLFESVASGVSSVGSVVVGTGQSASGDAAFIWDATHGMRELAGVLSDLGLDLTGWQLLEATDITPDGRRIVGVGINPSGDTEAWLAELPATGGPAGVPALGPWSIAIATAMMGACGVRMRSSRMC